MTLHNHRFRRHLGMFKNSHFENKYLLINKLGGQRNRHGLF